MHDEILEIIVFNAFNGMGEITGSDDYGMSVAWIDLQDYLDSHYVLLTSPYSGMDTDELSKICIEYNGGKRYALAYWYSSGSRDILGFEHKETMMSLFREFEENYDLFLEANDEGE